jgi:2-dehydropantoate 2-reductase
MRCIVFGAGAVGGLIAAALAPHFETALVARGAQRDAISQHGLRIVGLDGTLSTHRLETSAESGQMAPADIVFVTAKSHAVAAAADAIARSRKPNGMVIFVQNGVPWWYLLQLAPESLPPSHQALVRHFPGCAAGIAYFGGTVTAPGTVQHTGSGKLLLGAALGHADPRLALICKQLNAGPIPVEIAPDLPLALWNKLAVNAALNGIAALTKAPIADILAAPHLRSLLLGIVAEIAQLGASLGYAIDFDLQRQAALIGSNQKSSTLQDMEAGRPIEYDALFAWPQVIAERTDVPMPMLQLVAAMVLQRAKYG